MYTTMDCEFFEQTYYYPQPNPQGETCSDDLSWLIYPVVIDQDPKEQVGKTIDVVAEGTISPPLTAPVLWDEHPTSQEVLPELQQVTNNISYYIASNDVTSRYELPPRSTREIPPRRYDP